MNFKKRIAIVSTNNHIASGGIGIFNQAFVQMAKKQNWQVDFILDKPVKSWTDKLMELYYGCNFIYPSSPISYEKHNLIHTFTRGINFEVQINIRDAFVKASKKFIYDLIIINELDLIDPIISLELKVPVVFYTHVTQPDNLPKIKSPPKGMNAPAFRLPSEQQLRTVFIATQGEHNCDLIHEYYGVNKDRIKALPLPLLDEELANISDNIKKDGIMFIARPTKYKQFDEFARVVKLLNKKALIMATGKYSEKDFLKEIKEKGIENYEIKCEISGQEKINFIHQAEALYHPSELESFGYAVLEGALSCPSFVLENRYWSKLHKQWATITNINNVVNDINDALSKPYNNSSAVEYLKTIHLPWESFLNQTQPTKPINSKYIKTLSLPITVEGFTSYWAKKDYSHISYIQTLYSNKSSLEIEQTMNSSTIIKIAR